MKCATHLAVAILLMSCLDTAMTLVIVGNGGCELNPVMSAIMGFSVTLFILAKLALTGCGVIWLCFHFKAKVLGCPVLHVLRAIAIGYFVLIVYELVTLCRILLQPAAV